MHWGLGAKELVSKHGDDFIAWRWWVHREDGDYPIEVRISRSVIAVVEAQGDVSNHVYEAVKTDGAVALTGFAAWARPPDVVYVSTTGITSDGGREGLPTDAEVCGWLDHLDPRSPWTVTAEIAAVRLHLRGGKPLEVAIELAARDTNAKRDTVAQNWESLRAIVGQETKGGRD